MQEAAHPEANIIFGTTFDESLEDEIRVTLIATGFDEDQSVPFPHQREEEPAPVQQAAPDPEPIPPVLEPKSPVSDDDWDILERIFSKKR